MIKSKSSYLTPSDSQFLLYKDFCPFFKVSTIVKGERDIANIPVVLFYRRVKSAFKVPATSTTTYCNCVQKEEYSQSKLPEYIIPYKTCSTGAQTLSSTLHSSLVAYLNAPLKAYSVWQGQIETAKLCRCASKHLHQKLPLSHADGLVRSPVFGQVS